MEIILLTLFAVTLIFTSYRSKHASGNAIWFLVVTIIYLTLSIWNSVGNLSDVALLGSRIYGILMMPNVFIIVMFIVASVILENSKELDKINNHIEHIHPFSKLFYFTVIGSFVAGPAGTVGSCMILLTSFAKALMKDKRIGLNLIVGLVLVIATMGQLVPPAVLPIMINDVMTNTVQNFWFAQGIYDFSIAPSIELMNELYKPALIVLGLIISYLIYKVKLPNPIQFVKDVFVLSKGNLFFVSGIIGLSVISVLNYINVYEFSYLFIVLGMIITIKNKSFNFKFLKEVSKRSVSLTGGILVFLVIGNLLAFVFQLNGNYDTIINLFKFNELNFYETHAIYIGHLLALGMFLDPFEITYVFLPITANIMLMQQFDTVYIGALTTLVMQVAYLTPPIGFGLFYLKMLFPTLPFKDIVNSAIPFAVIQCIGIVCYIVMYFWN